MLPTNHVETRDYLAGAERGITHSVTCYSAYRASCKSLYSVGPPGQALEVRWGWWGSDVGSRPPPEHTNIHSPICLRGGPAERSKTAGRPRRLGTPPHVKYPRQKPKSPKTSIATVFEILSGPATKRTLSYQNAPVGEQGRYIVSI